MDKFEIPSIFIEFSITDDEGQFKPGFAVEARCLYLPGAIDNRVQFDVYYADGEADRFHLGVEGEYHLVMGNLGRRLFSIRIVAGYPSCKLISREEFRAILGPPVSGPHQKSLCRGDPMISTRCRAWRRWLRKSGTGAFCTLAVKGEQDGIRNSCRTMLGLRPGVHVQPHAGA